MKQKFLIFVATIILGVSGLAGTAFASVPVLSVTPSGNNYTLSVNNADANANITLYEKQSSPSWASINNWGTTDASGNFSQTMSLAFDGTNTALQLYVMVDGLQSGTIQVYSSGNNSGSATGTLSLSQMLVTINSGQTNVVTAYPTTGTIYISGNSNPAAASYSINGNQITVNGLATGGAIFTVCVTGGSQCNTITVSVNGGSTTGVTFSNASPVVTLGQSQTITIYSSNTASTSFYVSSNSNPSAVNASVSGSSLLLTAQNAGVASISVCQNGTSFCATLTATAGSSGGVGGISISQNSLSLSPGQTGTVNITNALGSLYVSNNSNSSVVSAGISGQTLSLYGIAAGGSTVTVCQNGYSGCVSVYVTVSGSNNSISGSLSFSNANPILMLGQTQSVTLYAPNGAANFNISSNSNSNAVSASISGSTLTLFGQNVGSSIINVCATSYSFCGNVNATVNGYSGGVNFSQSTVNLNLSQSQTITVSGGSGPYVLTSNTSPSTVSATLNGTSLFLTALNNGSSTLTVCQSGNTSACGQMTATVGSTSVSSGSIITFSNNTPQVNIGQTFSVAIYSTNSFTGNYVLSSNSNPAAASVSVSGSAINITGSVNGTTSLTVCQSGSTICGSLNATVGAGSVSPIAFITTSLPDPVAGQPYTYQLQASGGSAYSYAITSGNLPSGLTLSSSGLVSGTPTATGASNATITVTSGSSSSAVNFSLMVDPGVPTSVTIPVATSTTPSVTIPTDTTTPSTSGYVNGQLINENGTISIVYRNTKTPFANAASFLGLGFNFSNVTAVSNSGLPLSGKVVVTAGGAHPRGSWLLSGTTVYLITPDGLIPVPDWNTFLSNGGQASFIVKANSYDLAKPMLSVMTANDSRLQ